jgi:DNA-binding NarL/FixJ family response regulator
MSAEAGPIRILSMDDHPLMRQGVAALVGGQADMSLVAEASNGCEAIQQFRAHHPDVTLMDLEKDENHHLCSFCPSHAITAGAGIPGREQSNYVRPRSTWASWPRKVMYRRDHPSRCDR